MRVGIPKEIKAQEYRVGLAPAGVRELVARGHEVWVQCGAGAGIGVTDADYAAVGARLIADAASLFAQAQLVVKVKEPQPQEYGYLRPGQLLFTYLHLAAAPVLTQALCASGASCIAYETVTAAEGGLPLLAPMSEVAGRMAVQAGACYLEKPRQGRGVLLGGVPGVPPAEVLILGGGVVGSHAAMIASGMGARVRVLDRNLAVLRRLWRQFGHQLETEFATSEAVERHCLTADLVIGSVLVPGATAPRLVSRDLVGRMQPGAVLVDVAIDQGGCFATSRPTTHEDPVYRVGEVLHYCVANMPGAVPRTATFALNHATLPCVLALADQGLDALRRDPHLAAGLNVHAGQITHAGVALSLGAAYIPPAQALS